MAQTFRSRQLRLERSLDERFGREMAELARLMADYLLTQTIIREGQRIIPNLRQVRENIRAAVWAFFLKPYFIGSGIDPLNGAIPLSPYARLIFAGVQGGIAITAEQQAAIIRGATRGAADVYQYMTGARPFTSNFTITSTPSLRGFYDPFHRFVDPRGYTLSDKVWQNAVNVRSRIDRLLDYHIGRGTNFEELARELEAFLTPGAKTLYTNTPYGREGSYAARRLARTEITAEAGRSTINAAIANPFVEGVRWALSSSHPCCDVCDDYAAGGELADGVYPPEAVPPYPAHPHELCNLQPVVTKSRSAVVALIRADMRGERNYQGLFNERFLQDALLNGYLSEAAGAAVREMAVSYG